MNSLVTSSAPATVLPAIPEMDDRRFRRIGAWVVLGVFGGLGGWAMLAPLSSAAVAPGIVTVDGYRQTVQHLEGGIVKAIHVRDGDRVRRGQPLVTLDDTQSRAQLEVLRGQYLVALAREARLIAQRDGADHVAYPPELADAASDPRVADIIRIQDQTFTVRRQAQMGEIGIYTQQIDQLQAKTQGLRAQVHSLDTLVTSYGGELRDVKTLLREGYIEKQKVQQTERNLAQNVGQRGDVSSQIAEAQFQISEQRLRILQLKKDFQREVAAELSDVQNILLEVREKMRSLDSTVKRTVLTAPASGMVLGLSVHTIGAVVPPGGRILDIVPQRKKMLIDAELSPLDVDRVHVGQTAEVRLTAFKSRTTPRLEGRLVTLSPDRLVNEKTNSSYYLARVELTGEGVQSLAGRGLELVPGMPAEVFINSGSHTLFRYLTSPLVDGARRSLSED